MALTVADRLSYQYITLSLHSHCGGDSTQRDRKGGMRGARRGQEEGQTEKMKGSEAEAVRLMPSLDALNI